MPESAPSGRETVLRLDGITKRFGALLANDAITLEVARGEIVALLGENGAGKTTLMNILFGHYVADEGSITVMGKPLPPGHPRAAIAAGIGMVHQHFTLADNLSVLDNIILGTEPLWRPVSHCAEARAKVKKLARDFGLAVDPDATVSRLSVGERQRVEILKALYRDACILILDEPTAVLTPQESQTLFATLKKLVGEGLAIIFISHKLHEVLAVSDRIYVLRGGKLVAERDAKGTSRHELAELMVGRPIPEPKVEKQAPGAAQIVLSGVSTAGGLDHVDLAIHEGEILGLAGVSGNGQTALANLLSGLDHPRSGSFTIFGEDARLFGPRDMTARHVARIPEDRHAEGLIAGMSVTENVIAELYRDRKFNRRGFLDWAEAKRFAEGIIRTFAVKTPSAQAPAGQLSGGNMQKLILGRSFSLSPKFILACQPTRGLDIGAVAYVHERILSARGQRAAILLISDDLDEILSLSDRVAVIYRGRISKPLPRAEVTIKEIGLMMAGHGFAGEAHAA